MPGGAFDVMTCFAGVCVGGEGVGEAWEVKKC